MVESAWCWTGFVLPDFSADRASSKRMVSPSKVVVPTQSGITKIFLAVHFYGLYIRITGNIYQFCQEYMRLSYHR